MPTLRSVSAAEGAQDPDAQFHYVYGLLEEAFDTNAPFFRTPLYGSSVVRAEEIRRSLGKARDEYFSGSMYRQVVVRLLVASQTPAAQYQPYRQANEVLTSLYSQFYVRFGRPTSAYSDIIRDAKTLAANPQIPTAIRSPLDGIYATTQADRAAIVDGRNGQVTGVQLQLSEDIYVNFVLGNFDKGSGDESATIGLSHVELLVAPPTNS